MLLQHEPDIRTRKPVNLIGYRVEASLNDDIAGAIVAGLRDRLLSRAAEIPNRVGGSMSLAQVYPDGEWTPDVAFAHVVGCEAADLSAVPEGMIGYSVPGGTFLRFVHQGDESRIDETHMAINEWLSLHGYPDDRSFDVERWEHPENLRRADSIIEIYIPIG